MQIQWSHLLQMRGLKPLLPSEPPLPPIVASFTDAWIETYKSSLLLEALNVASFTDAWIETNIMCKSEIFAKVASFTDAWIETRT